MPEREFVAALVVLSPNSRAVSVARTGPGQDQSTWYGSALANTDPPTHTKYTTPRLLEGLQKKNFYKYNSFALVAGWSPVYQRQLT